MALSSILSPRVAPVATGLLLSVVSVADGQSLLTERLCELCSPRLEHVARLGTSDGVDLIAATDVITGYPPDGPIYLSHHFDRGYIYVFDRDGRFLRRMGRPGDGPGEFRVVMDLGIADDHLFAVDRVGLRFTLMNRDGSVQSTTRLPTSPGQGGTVALPSEGWLAIAAHIRSPELFGFALHTFDLAGNRLASFDPANDDALLPQDLDRLARRLSRAENGFWSADVNRYLVRKWDHEGALLASYQRSASWFAEWTQRSTLSPQGGRMTEVRDIHFDEDRQLLWMLIQVPSDRPDWTEGLISEARPDGRLDYGPGNLDMIYDTIVEAIRVETREVVLSFRVRLALRRFVGGDRVTSHVPADALGVEHVDVWKIVGIP